jgi:outer membrane protein assembly factor BamA
MKNAGLAGLLAVALGVGTAVAATGDKGPTYILNGFVINGVHRVDTSALEAKFKDKPGARITRADIAVDQAILAKELEARHISGELFAGLAEKNGHVWVIFEVQHPGQMMAKADKPPRHLDTQYFDGSSRIPPKTLAEASGLKKGDPLSPAKLNAARRAILAEYAKSMPGKLVTLKAKMRTRPDGGVTMIWMIGEPK